MQARQARLQEEFAASRRKGDIDRACRMWCAALAENAQLRHFTGDAFVLDGADLVQREFSRINDEGLKARAALWFYCVITALRPGDPECGRWEETAFSLARQAGTALDALAVGVVACTRRVWHGVAPGELGHLKHGLDALASLDAANGRPAMAWLAARMHLDLVYEPAVAGGAPARLLADTFERAARAGDDLSASPLGSAEFFRHLSSGKIEEARGVLHRVAPLTSRLAPYDAWMFWLYKTWLSVAADDAEAAMLESNRALGFAHQSGLPHAVFWAKLAVARAFAATPAGSGVWRRLADSRREARSLGLNSLIALCRSVSALVAIARGRASRAAVLGAAALQALEANRMLRPPLFTSRDFELIFQNVDTAQAPGLLAAHSHRRVVRNASERSRPVDVRCLGAFSIEREGELLVWPRKVPRRPLDLLKVTIAHGPGGASVSQLTDALWSGMEGDRAHRAFATALYRLRGLVGDDVLDLSAGRLSLNRARVRVDAFEFEDAAAGCGSDATLDRAVLALYGGIFLPEQLEDPWAAGARDRLRELFRAGMRKTVECLLDEGHWHDALELLEDGLKRDPLAEIFYQRAIAACYVGGLRAEASAYYERCRSALSEHLGVSPSRRTEALYRDGLRATG